ncbi:hypothetical protein ANOM_010881 [Aspergillus nomiae NRRL 13137]|uniref:Uncharacterized protein n=1 Tax=Aspergillus nomiae NRRL (strain ATCC 15546 / NRRL 13137 / CBS 260.88 / M93) TaxID=1509407 RepID=A0A0L1IPD6_ASPN3|nr:uncharacterized protein ANOM_010881 [Aspergillus nomiae NRRL 13137]KNG81190.1 hypothetical protein ANOM_010881 [Aspergillus nomiae NRRL 13137]
MTPRDQGAFGMNDPPGGISDEFIGKADTHITLWEVIGRSIVVAMTLARRREWRPKHSTDAPVGPRKWFPTKETKAQRRE